MKNSAVDRMLMRPSIKALFSLSMLMLMGPSGSWASGESQSNESSRQSNCELTDQKQEMLSLVNEARSQERQCGDQQYEAVEPLVWSCKLEAAAENHSKDMAENGYFSHTGPDGVGIQQRISNQDYVWQAVGENIAAGQSSASAVVAGWLESPGHCRNIMNNAFTEMGMAEASNSETRYSTYWTQTLGNPR